MLKQNRLFLMGIVLLLIFVQTLSFVPNKVFAESETNKATLEVIDDKGTLVEATTATFSDEDTAFDLLKVVVGEENIAYTESANGIMLTGIKDVSPKKDSTTFWAFYINGVSSQVGVNDYKLKTGDKITFILKDWTAPAENTATLNVQDIKELQNVQVDFLNEPTVFDVIRVMAGKKELKYQEYDFGNLVTSIDGISNTEDKYWLVYVNDKPLEVSSDKYTIKNGDKIDFKFEGLPNTSEESDTNNNQQINSETLEQIIVQTIKYAEKDGISDWEALALSKLGKEIPNSYKKTLKENVKSLTDDSKKITETEKSVLALLAIGEDPANYQGKDLVKMVLNADVEKQGLNGVAYALIVLDATNYKESKDLKWSKEKLIQYLIEHQNGNGGWNWAAGKESDLDSTAIVLTSLAPFKGEETVSKVIDNGLSFIQSKIDDVNNSSTASEVLFTLSTLGIDAQTEYVGQTGNLVSQLISYQNNDGGFYWQKKEGGQTESDPFSTEYAIRALTAYQLYLNNQGSFFDLHSDQKDTNQSKATDNNNQAIYYILLLVVIIIVGVILYLQNRKRKGKQV